MNKLLELSQLFKAKISNFSNMSPFDITLYLFMYATALLPLILLPFIGYLSLTIIMGLISGMVIGYSLMCVYSRLYSHLTHKLLHIADHVNNVAYIDNNNGDDPIHSMLLYRIYRNLPPFIITVNAARRIFWIHAIFLPLFLYIFIANIYIPGLSSNQIGLRLILNILNILYARALIHEKISDPLPFMSQQDYETWIDKQS